ncbi:MAG: two pore domain potassium channel family protein [Acidobacteria bacterium]|nr:two pore domain potassium channel family protein [Acidobacteriota bacterium]
MFKSHPHKFLYLLISLLLFALVFPVLEELGRGRVIFALFYSATLLAAAYAVSESRGYFFLALILAGPAFVLRWINDFREGPWLVFVADVLTILFLLVVAMLILSHVLKAERVSREKIFGALSVYLLLGVIWAFLFLFVDFLVPGSFRYGQDEALTGVEMVYYSFVTLTTLGYGDIVPISPSARALATLEAVTGQLFLTVLVARLVGLQITHSSRYRSEDQEKS